MIRDFRSNLSKCGECPLRDKRRVFSDVGESPRIAIIGEAPGEEEERSGSPFIGPAGAELNRGLTGAGIRRAGCWVTNTICCRPAHNDISSEEAQEAIRCCSYGLLSELDQMRAAGVRVVIALGNTASEVLGIEGQISKSRGSVYLFDRSSWTRYLRAGPPLSPYIDVTGVEARGGDSEDTPTFPIVPTYHPAALLYSRERTIARGSGSALDGTGGGPSSHILRPVFTADLAKARRIAESGWKPPTENFITRATNEATVKFLDSIPVGARIAIDLETTGFDPKAGEIFCVGIATSPNDAICIPAESLRHGGISASLRSLLGRCRSIFQNAKFDVGWLETKGYRVGNIEHDIMLMHHAVSPELPHDLGFIVSIYGDTPYWKGHMLARDLTLNHMPWQLVAEYNCRDAVVLHQVLPGLLEDLKETGSEKAYEEISMKMIRPIMHMESHGMKLSKSRIESWRKELLEETVLRIQRAGAIIGCTQVNFNSDDELRWIIFGTMSKKLSSAGELLPTKKRTDSLLYKELERLETVSKMKPLLTSEWIMRNTSKGKGSVSDENLLSIVRKANNRISLISRFKRPTPEHLAEQKQLERTVDFISELREVNKVTKLYSTYTSFPHDAEMRVHPSFLIHGTTTGRLSCKSPNLQNQPESARTVFVADEGNILVSADYSNLELRVLAYISEDDVMLDQFEKGLNVHDENTKALFGIKEEHPKWKQLRKAAKIYIFGRNYGGSVEGIFERIIAEVPDSGLTLGRFRAVDEAYRRLHPRYTRWYERTKSEILEKRRIANAFGRVRIFYGNEKDIVKEGLNTPIQGTAADIINTATIRIDNEGLPIVCQVHDQLLFEIKKGGEHDLARTIKPLMERGFIINGRSTVFPVDITAGECWRGMEALAV